MLITMVIIGISLAMSASALLSIGTLTENDICWRLAGIPMFLGLGILICIPVSFVIFMNH